MAHAEYEEQMSKLMKLKDRTMAIFDDSVEPLNLPADK
jgi:hypothetical protein